MKSPDAYMKLAIIKIARQRFRAFERKFGHIPRPTEPIFFDESKDAPVKASPKVARVQLTEAALASGIRIDPLLQFLGLPVAEVMRKPSKGKSTHSAHRRGFERSARKAPPGHYGLNHFLANPRLLRQHAITAEEVGTLSRIAFLGRVRTVDGFLAILCLIRKSED